MATQSPLRRWKRFLPVFDTIDVAAVVAGRRLGEVARAEALRRVKRGVLVILSYASEDDPAEEWLRTLDNVMFDYLVMLRSVPMKPSELASTGLVEAVSILQEHETEKISELARDLVDKWTVLVEVRELCDELSNLASAKSPKIAPVVHAVRDNAASTDKMVVPKKMKAIVGNGGRDHARIENKESSKRKFGAGYQEAEGMKRQRKTIVMEEPNMVKQQQQQHKPIEQRHRNTDAAKISVPVLKASTPKVVSSERKKSAPVVGLDRAKMPEMNKMEATQRRLRAAYQDAADAKHRREVKIIEAPEMTTQSRRKVQPIIVRQRSQAKCATSTAVRRSMASSFRRV